MFQINAKVISKTQSGIAKEHQRTIINIFTQKKNETKSIFIAHLSTCKQTRTSHPLTTPRLHQDMRRKNFVYCRPFEEPRWLYAMATATISAAKSRTTPDCPSSLSAPTIGTDCFGILSRYSVM